MLIIFNYSSFDSSSSLTFLLKFSSFPPPSRDCNVDALVNYERAVAEGRGHHIQWSSQEEIIS